MQREGLSGRIPDEICEGRMPKGTTGGISDETLTVEETH